MQLATKKPHRRPHLGEHEPHLVVELTSQIAWTFGSYHPSHPTIPYLGPNSSSLQSSIGTYEEHPKTLDCNLIHETRKVQQCMQSRKPIESDHVHETLNAKRVPVPFDVYIFFRRASTVSSQETRKPIP